MPKFQGKLTDEEIRQAVAYVLALDRTARAERDAHRAAPAAPAP
jgi:mono/diheme cytochrome c family protein